MLWLFAIILAYLLFAMVSLGDRFLLLGAPNPKVYVFYVGGLGILSCLLIPFVGFDIPPPGALLLCFLGGLFYVGFLYLMYCALEKFEVSRIIPATGALVPLISLILIYFLSKDNSFWDLKSGAAFLLLVAGSVIVNSEFSKSFSLKTFKLAFVIAFLASLTFIFSKYAFLNMGFWPGFIWMRIFTFAIILLFLFSGSVRKELFGKKKSFTKNGLILFFVIQILGASAFILQNWAIDLAGLSLLPVINALQGVQYVFLFFLALIVSLKFPQAIRENITKKVIFQKILAIFLIAAGFIFLAS
ncbi:MAG: hypothetical protein Q8N69_01415 [bacterium]|nr:hypothetical protein [bacterium]